MITWAISLKLKANTMRKIYLNLGKRIGLTDNFSASFSVFFFFSFSAKQFWFSSGYRSSTEEYVRRKRLLSYILFLLLQFIFLFLLFLLSWFQSLRQVTYLLLKTWIQKLRNIIKHTLIFFFFPFSSSLSFSLSILLFHFLHHCKYFFPKNQKKWIFIFFLS